MSRVVFRERMKGYMSFAETDWNQALLDGRRFRRRCGFRVEIAIEDLPAVLAGSGHGTLTGRIDCRELGGRLEVDDGTFDLFVHGVDRRMKRMRYRLFATDPDGRELTLSGFKDVVDSPNFDLWSDTTTLMFRLIAGHVTEEEEQDEVAMASRTIATGVMRITLLRFLRLLVSLRFQGGSPLERVRTAARFLVLFVGELLQVYGGAPVDNQVPDFPDPVEPGRERWQGYPPDEWHEPPELPGLSRRICGYTTEDRHRGTLHNIRRDRGDLGRMPVLLIPGTGVRGNLFYGAPGRASVIPHLLDAGYDVWIENWRGSIDLPPDRYTLDEAALFDHPAAIDRVLELSGQQSLRVLCHCQGSTSFMITYLAGLLGDRVDRVVSSAVSLHPIVPRRARWKMQALVPLLGFLMPYVSAQWGARPPTPLAHLVALTSRWGRRGHDPVCALGSFMYGSGHDVLWRHANLDPVTHHWTSREFGYAPFRFFKQMRKSVLAGHLVPVTRFAKLPRSYVDAELPTGVTWKFIAGDMNELFLCQSQRRTYEHFQQRQPGVHSLAIIPGCGHLDVLFGTTAPKVAYPEILEGLGPPGERRPVTPRVTASGGSSGPSSPARRRAGGT
jgi:hypothetical protein